MLLARDSFQEPQGDIAPSVAEPCRTSQGGGGAGGLPDQAVYLDSPVLSALRQIQPFYESGAFGASTTPLFLRRTALSQMQRLMGRVPRGLDIRWIKGRAARLPVAKGGVVFYPFNARSNLQTVTQRELRHVLTLHGESNKGASMRPAARIYDYVSIAGPLARDRYLRAGIFTADDVDRGRLVMMGDTFVQPMPMIRPAQDTEAGAVIFYAPTWEGFGGQADDHNSVTGQRGFVAALQAAEVTGCRHIVVKPHPYLGLLRPAIAGQFLAGLHLLRDAGLRVSVMMEGASLPLRLASVGRLRGVQPITPTAENPLSVRLGLCDVSGVEAIFLKQRIPHLVMARADAVPPEIERLYLRKAILPGCAPKRDIARYLEAAAEIDAAHRAHVFGWNDPALCGCTAVAARRWLIDYVRRDPFWGIFGG